MGRAQLFEKLLGEAKEIAGPALTSGAFTGLLGLVGGMSPKDALLYGAADTLASAGSVGLVRKLRPKPPIEIRNALTGELMGTEPGRSKLEVPVNIAASLLTGSVLSNLMGPSQAEQVAQQANQRAALNATSNNPLIEATTQQLNDQLNQQFNSLTAGALSPGTLFQNQGLSGNTLQTMRQQAAERFADAYKSQLDIPSIMSQMGGIVGV